jgi:hypothetical protein
VVAAAFAVLRAVNLGPLLAWDFVRWTRRRPASDNEALSEALDVAWDELEKRLAAIEAEQEILLSW